MKNQIARQLNEVAAGMPQVFEWHEGTAVMSGSDLNLTPLSKNQTFDPAKDYEIPMPYMVAVEHKQQMKDAFKRGGWDAVRVYHKSVLDKIRK